MRILLVLVLLTAGIPAGTISVSCGGCCEQAVVGADAQDAAACCRLAPEPPQPPSRPAAAATAIRPDLFMAPVVLASAMRVGVALPFPLPRLPLIALRI